MILLGYRMWWQRRPTSLGFGPPVPRGAWRSVPSPLLVLLGLGAGAVGWFLPLFGLPLLAFPVLDGALGWRANRRARPPAKP